MQHMIYRTTCLITGKWYIGMHSARSDKDSYFGSGKIISASLKKHGRKNHIREIIATADSRSALRLLETQIVTIKLLQDPMCMNLALGGCGSGVGRIVSAEARAKMAIAKVGRPRTEESRKKQGDAIRGENHHASRCWVLLTPEGEILRVLDMGEFCEQNSLNYFSLRNRAYFKDVRPISRGPSKGWSVLGY